MPPSDECPVLRCFRRRMWGHFSMAESILGDKGCWFRRRFDRIMQSTIKMPGFT